MGAFLVIGLIVIALLLTIYAFSFAVFSNAKDEQSIYRN